MKASMNTQKCPICGEEQQLTEVTEEYTPPFGARKVFNVPIIDCQECGNRTSSSEADKIVEQAHQEADKASVELILGNLNKLGISNARFERVFRLPPRTLARWKNGECSASAVALLRCVRTYPWLMKVADQNFDNTYAENRLVEQARLLLEAHERSIRSASDRYRVDISGSQSNADSIEDNSVFVSDPKPALKKLASTGGLDRPQSKHPITNIPLAVSG